MTAFRNLLAPGSQSIGLVSYIAEEIIGGFTFGSSKIAFRAARKFSSRSPIFEPSATPVLIVSVAAVSDRRKYDARRTPLQVYSPSTFCIEYTFGGLLIDRKSTRLNSSHVS